MRVVIFANGDFIPNLYSSQALRLAELIVAADNGARYCFSHGILPDVLIGDLDSLAPSLLQELEAAETQIITHPQDKDETDLELALDHALHHRATHVTILGGLGGRWDMSLANIFLLAHKKYQKLAICVVGHDHVMYIINADNPLKLQGRKGDTVSLLPLTPVVTGVSTLNLRYPLQGEELHAAGMRGVSNELLGTEGNIVLDEGVLLCVHTAA
jgi:thiamine pyrophosphokinase